MHSRHHYPQIMQFWSLFGLLPHEDFSITAIINAFNLAFFLNICSQVVICLSLNPFPSQALWSLHTAQVLIKVLSIIETWLTCYHTEQIKSKPLKIVVLKDNMLLNYKLIFFENFSSLSNVFLKSQVIIIINLIQLTYVLYANCDA